MSSINPGFSQIPIASSVAGISSSGKNSSAEKAAKADGSAAKVVEKANSETGGIQGSEKSSDRDVDGRQLHEETEESSAKGATQAKPSPPRSKDPQKLRGNTLDFDA
jgi:hypothetical protein